MDDLVPEGTVLFTVRMGRILPGGMQELDIGVGPAVHDQPVDEVNRLVRAVAHEFSLITVREMDASELLPTREELHAMRAGTH